VLGVMSDPGMGASVLYRLPERGNLSDWREAWSAAGEGVGAMEPSHWARVALASQ